MKFGKKAIPADRFFYGCKQQVNVIACLLCIWLYVLVNPYPDKAPFNGKHEAGFFIEAVSLKE